MGIAADTRPESTELGDIAVVGGKAGPPVTGSDEIVGPAPVGDTAVAQVDQHKQDMQPGVRRMVAVTEVWTRRWLYTAYALVWLIVFTNSLQQIASYAWTPYVTSAFRLHGLTAMTGVVANIVGGVSKLPLAKFVDVVGRPQGFLVCLSAVILALILMASCQNVQTYAAAQVFYWSGMNGMSLVLTIFMADTSSMRNRMLILGFSSTPYICNTFAGPNVGQAFLDSAAGWRWGFGAFAVICPIVSMPFWAIFHVLTRRAVRRQILSEGEASPTKGMSLRGKILYYANEFDVMGLLLVCAGFSLLFLPFSLANYQAKGWESPLIIGMLVGGAVGLALFALWERFLALKSLFPFHLLSDRSVAASCLIAANWGLSFYSYKIYYGSYLQVVHQLSVSQAGYITSMFNLVSAFWGIPLALLFRYTDRHRWAAVLALPLQILTAGLLVPLRSPGTSVGALVAVEFFASIAGGTLITSTQISLMSAVLADNVAVGLALLGMATYLGAAAGQTIAGAIWTQTLPAKLAAYLPADVTADSELFGAIYGDITTQLGYEWGSPVREAIVAAYGDTQRLMVIVGVSLLAPLVIWVGMMRNNRLSDSKNTSDALVF